MNTIFQTVLETHAVEDAINLENPYKGTILETYHFLQPTQKGKFGEIFLKKVCAAIGHSLKPRLNKQHDIIINGVKGELKFSVEYGGGFRFNHIAATKDFDRLILAGINKDIQVDIKFIEKSDVITIVNERMFNIRRQQNGNKGTNDDWMITPSIDEWNEMISHPFVKDFTQW